MNILLITIVTVIIVINFIASNPIHQDITYLHTISDIKNPAVNAESISKPIVLTDNNIFINDKHIKTINIEIESHIKTNFSSQNGSQNNEEFSTFWEKVYDEEVAKHERQLEKFHRNRKNVNRHSNNQISKNGHAIIDTNFKNIEALKDTYKKFNNENLSENKNDGLNKEDAYQRIKPLQNLTKLNLSKKPTKFKSFGLFKRTHTRRIQTDDDDQEVNSDEEIHNNKAVVKLRSRQRNDKLNNPSKQSDADETKLIRVGKTHNSGVSEHDQESQKHGEVRDTEDRKRLPRNAAWFVQAALRMCETGQDPRCKKISLRKGNVKINIKIAED